MLTVLQLFFIRRRLPLRVLLGGNYVRPFEDSETCEDVDARDDEEPVDGAGHQRLAA